MIYAKKPSHATVPLSIDAPHKIVHSVVPVLYAVDLT